MIRIALVCFAVLLAGCQSTGPDTAAIRIAAEAAVNTNTRPETDTQLDAGRKPVDTLTFFEIQPGMKVIDIFGGGGYYTEIISYLVGEEGSVTLYNNNPWDDFVNKAVSKRLENNRLPNVQSWVAPPVDLGTHKDIYDAAIFILGMHDIYYEDPKNNWPAIDVGGFLGDINGLLKPGAVFGIIDHNALAGTDPTTVGLDLHRIDPAVIIRDLEAAGFEYVGESDVLRHPEDSMTELVFKPELRWKTDRSVLKFRKR